MPCSCKHCGKEVSHLVRGGDICGMSMIVAICTQYQYLCIVVFVIHACKDSRVLPGSPRKLVTSRDGAFACTHASLLMMRGRYNHLSYADTASAGVAYQLAPDRQPLHRKTASSIQFTTSRQVMYKAAVARKPSAVCDYLPLL